jgi:hypothetical protein
MGQPDQWYDEAASRRKVRHSVTEFYLCMHCAVHGHTLTSERKRARNPTEASDFYGVTSVER